MALRLLAVLLGVGEAQDVVGLGELGIGRGDLDDPLEEDRRILQLAGAGLLGPLVEEADGGLGVLRIGRRQRVQRLAGLLVVPPCLRAS